MYLGQQKNILRLRTQLLNPGTNVENGLITCRMETEFQRVSQAVKVPINGAYIKNPSHGGATSTSLHVWDDVFYLPVQRAASSKVQWDWQQLLGYLLPLTGALSGICAVAPACCSGLWPQVLPLSLHTPFSSRRQPPLRREKLWAKLNR